MLQVELEISASTCENVPKKLPPIPVPFILSTSYPFCPSKGKNIALLSSLEQLIRTALDPTPFLDTSKMNLKI